MKSINFSGYQWLLKNSLKEKHGPGPNYFNNSDQSIWLDKQNSLHMKIKYDKFEQKWQCSQIILKKSLGYGKYQITIKSELQILDTQVVLGIFIYDQNDQQNHYKQIDIQYSKWGKSNNQNLQFVVQPNTIKRFKFIDIKQNENDEQSSYHQIFWRKDKIDFQIGFIKQNIQKHKVIQWQLLTQKQKQKQKTYSIPIQGNQHFRINLWLFKGYPPKNNEQVQIIIQQFKFIKE